MGFNNDRDRPSTIKLVPSAALSTCNYGVRSTTDLAGIMIMCTSGATCLFADGCLTTAKNPTKHVGLLFESGHHHLIEMLLVPAMTIADNLMF